MSKKFVQAAQTFEDVIIQDNFYEVLHSFKHDNSISGEIIVIVPEDEIKIIGLASTFFK